MTSIEQHNRRATVIPLRSGNTTIGYKIKCHDRCNGIVNLCHVTSFTTAQRIARAFITFQEENQ